LLIGAEDVPCDHDLPIHELSEKMRVVHGWNGPIPRAHEVFEAIGLQLDVIDREIRDGCERVVDLNEHAGYPNFGLGAYDLVVDPGTLEHCFNIAQAGLNLANAVTVGGHIAQAVPMSMFNHGYYNLNPIWFIDLYSEANGFAIKRLLLRHADGIFEPLNRRRLRDVPNNGVLVCLAQRIRGGKIGIPQQP
jgi:hypothetical protein